MKMSMTTLIRTLAYAALIGTLACASPAAAVDTLDVRSPDPILEAWRWTEFEGSSGLAGLVREMFEDREGNIWIGTSQGVQRYDGHRWTTYTTEDGLAENSVSAIMQAEDGAMWFGDVETTLPEARFEARIAGVDVDSESVMVDRALPEGMQLDGRLCRMEAVETDVSYSHSSAYCVVSARGRQTPRLVLQHGDPRLVRGTAKEVEGPDVLVCDVPLAFAWGFNNTGDKGEYRGKVLRTEDGLFQSRIVDLLGFKKIRLVSVEGLQVGARFEILDFK